MGTVRTAESNLNGPLTKVEDRRPMSERHSELWLVRHGETEWSTAGRHTGRTDIALTPTGERQAAGLGRIWRTGRLRSSCAARYGVHVRPVGWLGTGASQHSSRSIGMGLQNLRGSYDERNPNRGAGWSIWTGSVPGGETIEQVGHRAERVIKQGLAAGDVLLFAHSHILRVLTACWLDLPPDAGRLFALNTASMSVLGYEHEDRVISVWNQD
jgi:broad specificity phosphatase PhoE